ncbi:3'-5' exonuclease [Halomonas sp. 86]|uniref:3'-5' exonuclease n=1 Tax=unclassified Halomonas TaxID=2609666 RepID=UPI0040335809
MNSITFTNEQKAIIDFKGHRLIVKAFAGTGKTFTMVQYALANPDKRYLYLAFNRSVRDEAVQKFPSNVDCMTYNQLCYQQVGIRYRGKLVSSLRLTEVVGALGLRNAIEARDVVNTIDCFCNSDDGVLGLEHFRTSAKRVSQHYMREVVAGALGLWAQMIDVDHPTSIHHNACSKLFELSSPDLSSTYDGILYDEGQDSPPSTISVLARQRCQVIIIGDPAQSIYLFRDAVDALSSPALAESTQLTLTESFRFGSAVATVANSFLLLRGEQRRVKGLGGEDQAISHKEFSWAKHQGQVCLLSRKVATVLAVALYFSAKGKKVGFVGGFESYGFDYIEQVHYLFMRQMDKLKGTRLLREFPTYQQYEAFAEDTRDNEMLRTCRIISDYPFLPAMLADLRQQVTAPELCDIMVGTVHKSKGLEFDTVYLTDDFPDLFDEDQPYTDAELEQEINLMYVAVTRAAKMLVLNDSALDVIKRVSQFQLETPHSIPVAT